MLNDYIAKFNYQHNYEQGLALLTKATEKHHLDHKYLDTFIANRVTIKGAPLPEGLSFLDADGNRHTMEEFRGKYVYIDFWASWCVPCCREVPHLQKLEAELNNDNVVFLSISIDKTETPWRKKMAELSMHGNQSNIPRGNDACSAIHSPTHLTYAAFHSSLSMTKKENSIFTTHLAQAQERN